MILQADNKILRKVSGPVENIPGNAKLIKELAEAMFKEPDGIGIAAPQIGKSLQIFLVADDVFYPERFESEKTRTKGYLVFINPVIIKASRKKNTDIEGCLSVRGKYGDVVRTEKISVEYTDETGKRKSRGASGLFARVIQHEIDHLQGILFIDKAKNVKKADGK